MIAASSGLLMPVSKWLFRYARENTRAEGCPKASTERSIFISPVVSVPVLSVQSTSMLPKFWIAARCLTMTFLRAMRTAPVERVTVVIIGRNSGVSPTARATAKSRDSSAFLCIAIFTTRMNRTRNITVSIMRIPN